MSAAPPLAAPPPRRHGTLILIVVFVLGLIAGGGVMYGWAPRLHRRHREPLHELLDLNATQLRQFNAVVATLRQHYAAVHGQFEPQFRKLHDQEDLLRGQEFAAMQPFRDQADARIRAFLDPNQRTKFDAWLAEFHRHHPAPPASAATHAAAATKR